jgi:2-desacetyl-2-hydroxyethyl bacteriochlorophyllide A dehydrogenase
MAGRLGGGYDLREETPMGHAAPTLTATTATRIVFTGKNQLALEPWTPPEPAAGEVRVRARWSLMSTGTETIVLHRRFERGSGQDRWVQYPFYPGYAQVGTVERVGDSVQTLAVGDVVVSRAGHASHAVAPAGAFTKVPMGVDEKDAAWFALAKIAAIGARAVGYALGDQVLVIGAGPIGQMSLRWAVAAGAERVVVLDPFPARLAFAQQGGASGIIVASVHDALEPVRASFGGSLPNVVIDATGHHQVLGSALALAGGKGRILVIGDTGTPSEQRMSSDLMAKGLTIIAAHDSHEEPGWNAARYYRLFFSLIAAGRFPLAALATHAFTPERCVEAYAAADDRRSETMGIFFDWRQA